MQDFPKTILELAKGKNIDLLSMDILSDVDNWTIGLKYNDEHKELYL